MFVSDLFPQDSSLLESLNHDEFVQQELAKRDINVERVVPGSTHKHFPTKTKLYIDGEEQTVANQVLRQLGLSKEYEVVSAMGSFPSIKKEAFGEVIPEKEVAEAPRGERWKVLCKYPDLKAGPNHIASVTWTGLAPNKAAAGRYAVADLAKSGKQDAQAVRATRLGLVDEAFADQGAGHSEKDSHPIAHRIAVTVIDPFFQGSPKGENEQQRFVRINGNKETAIARAKQFYKKRGYKVIDAYYVNPVFKY